MSELIDDKLNLEILENICSGIGVDVNINALSKSCKKHKNTIKSHVNALFEHKIINKPVYPFIWLYQEYPLLILAKSELPRNRYIDKFLKEDEHVFGVFYVRDKEYNALLIEFHKDVHSYGEWRNRIVAEHKIPTRELRYPSYSLFFSVKSFIKYQPYAPIYSMEEKLKNGKYLEINGYKIDTLSFQILKKLIIGEGIRTNENTLAQNLNINRKTIERRINLLVKNKIVSEPMCRFPKFFVPPEHILIICLVEIKKSKDKIINAIKSDPHIPLALDANIGRYNILLFKVFSNVEEHFVWEERYDNIFPSSIGAMETTFLSPRMTVSIDQQKVSLGIIKHRKELLRGRELIENRKVKSK